MNPTILVETARLKLRHFTLEDTEKVFQMSLESGIQAWIPDQVYADLQQTREVLEFLIGVYTEIPNPKKDPLVLGIELKLTGELIGHVGLSPTENGIEIGYAIEDRNQRKGYATEAIHAISRWAVDVLGIPVLFGIVDSKNSNSIRALEKSGYVFSESKEKHAFGRICSCEYYLFKSAK